MNKSKYFVMFLLLAVIFLLSVSTVFAGGPDPEWCKKCCASEYGKKGQCTGCTCDPVSGGPEPPVVVIRPQDTIGEYYVGDGDVKQYVSFKTWDSCMNYFGDAAKCSRIVTNPCESCMGLCRHSGGNACSITCKDSCKGISGVTITVNNDDPNSGNDDYGDWYIENGQKKYSRFNNFRGCWSIVGNAKECAKYGYYCGYKNGFYISNLCDWNDDECRARVKSEYAAACD